MQSTQSWVFALVKSMTAAGNSRAEIAAELTRRGLRNKQGRPTTSAMVNWYRRQLKKPGRRTVSARTAPPHPGKVDSEVIGQIMALPLSEPMKIRIVKMVVTDPFAAA